MPLRSAAVGAQAEPQIVELTPRLTMAFAAGIGDANPCYLDDAAAEGIVAPPTMCAALEWPAMRAVRRIAELGLSDDEALRTVHAGQDSEFHRLMRPGDRLRTEATVVQVRRLPPGAYLLTKFTTVDDTTGEPVVTTYSASIARGVAVAGDDLIAEEPPPLRTAEDGPTMPGTVAIGIPPEAAHVYTECARIWNPIHTERRVALAAGLPDIILHGTALWSLAARELVNRCAEGEPARLKRLAGRFSAMVIPGATVALQYGLQAGEPPTLQFTMRNAVGDAAISHGAAVIVP